MSESLLTGETRMHRAKGGDLYRIQFHEDLDPREPWDDAGAVPLLAYDGRGDLHHEPAGTHDLESPLDALDDSRIAAKLREIVAALNKESEATHRAFLGCYADTAEILFSGPSAFDAAAREEYPDLTLREARREWLHEFLGDGDVSQRRLETLAALWRAAGVPAQVLERRGYCQGDFAALLLVAHPDAVKEWGFVTVNGRPNWKRYAKACPQDFERAADSYASWRWGGVIGYVVEWIDPQEYAAEIPGDVSPSSSDLDALTECEAVDSCWGFYPEHDQHYFPLTENHPYAISEAIEAAEADSRARASCRAAAFVAQITAERPDLAPQWDERA